MLRRTVFLLGKVFDRHNMERIKRGNFSISVQSRKRSRAEQNKFRMWHHIFTPVRSAQAEWAETSREAAFDAVNSHRRKITRGKVEVNSGLNPKRPSNGRVFDGNDAGKC